VADRDRKAFIVLLIFLKSRRWDDYEQAAGQG